MSWDSFIQSRWATYILGVILIFVMVLAARIVISKYQIDAQINKLEAEAAKVKKDNDQLSILNQYLKTPDYQDKAAREKLNLKKDGEVVVGLPNNDDASVSGSQTQATAQSNFRQWFNYFFSNP